jgi:hypothetical protein
VEPGTESINNGLDERFQTRDAGSREEFVQWRSALTLFAV